MRSYRSTELGYLDFEFKDDDGAYYTPDTISVELYDEGDTLRATFNLTTTPPVEAISTGNYMVQNIALTLFAEGIAYFKVYATKAAADVQPYPYLEHCFEVLADDTSSGLCTLQELKDHLELTTSDRDEILRRLIMRATSFIESYCQRSFIAQSHTERYVGDNTRRLNLKNFPVIAITSIADVSDQAFFSFGASDEHVEWECYYECGILELLASAFPAWPPRAIQIVYTAGFVTLPEDLRQVCIELAAAKFYLMDKQRQGILQKMVGGQTVMYRPDDLSPAQKMVLDNYARITYGAV